MWLRLNVSSAWAVTGRRATCGKCRPTLDARPVASVALIGRAVNVLVCVCARARVRARACVCVCARACA